MSYQSGKRENQEAVIAQEAYDTLLDILEDLDIESRNAYDRHADLESGNRFSIKLANRHELEFLLQVAQNIHRGLWRIP